MKRWVQTREDRIQENMNKNKILSGKIKIVKILYYKIKKSISYNYESLLFHI